MIDWGRVTAELQAWVAAGTGLDTTRVIWAYQNEDRPQNPWVDLELLSCQRLGQDWLDIADNPASNGHDGQEIVRTARGPRLLTVRVRAFGSPGPFDPSKNPVVILEALMASAPLRASAFDSVGLGLARFNDVVSTYGVVDDTVLEPRATVDVVFHLAQEVAQFETYIEFVRYQGTVDGTAQPTVTVGE